MATSVVLPTEPTELVATTDTGHVVGVVDQTLYSLSWTGRRSVRVPLASTQETLRQLHTGQVTSHTASYISSTVLLGI